MEQRFRAPFAGMNRIRFQGTVSIRPGAKMRPQKNFRIPLADPGIFKRWTARVNGTGDALETWWVRRNQLPVGSVRMESGNLSSLNPDGTPDDMRSRKVRLRTSNRAN